MQQENFGPIATVPVASPSTSSQRVDLAAILPAGTGPGVDDCLVTNDTDKLAFVKFGNNASGASPVVATTADTPIRPGAQIVLNKGAATGAAVIMSGAPSSGSVYFTVGTGS